MISAKVYLGITILAILTVQIISLPQDLSFQSESISFGDKTNADDNKKGEENVKEKHFEDFGARAPAPDCPREQGFCVTPSGRDQESGWIKLNNLDGDTTTRQQECLRLCRSVPNVTGCEVIFGQVNRGCYAHTKELGFGNGRRNHFCWVFSKCGTSGTGDNTNNDSQEDLNERQTQNCCCVHASSTCPNQRNSGGNGGFLNAVNPRIKSANDSEPADDFGVAVRIVNNPTEHSQPQVQLEPYCEAHERSCCYDSSSTLNDIISQSRCITRSRPANRNVIWDQKCSETQPRRIRTGEKRCGERRFREISGKEKGEANPGEFPWTCLVLNQDNDFVGSCAIVPDNKFNDVRGGTDRVIIAAHKLKGIKEKDEVKVRVIEYDASGFKRPENTRHQEYVVQEIHMHPQFDPTRLSYDLAVLKVETKPDGFGGIKGRIDLTATDDINSACLPGCPNMFGHKFANGTGVRCWVAGWGKDSIDGNFQIVQNKVDVPLMGRSECQKRMKAALGPDSGRNFELSPSEICAGGEEGKDACDGDGGAPLVCQSRDDRWHVVGLVTWGVDCARKGVPGVYANINHMLDFILTV